MKGEFGSSNGPILLERLSCTGNENDIAGCLLNWKSANCTGQGAVGIRCGKWMHASLTGQAYVYLFLIFVFSYIFR